MDPLLLFFILVGILLVVPLVMAHIKIPAILGLILIGYLFGPHGLSILPHDPVLNLFSSVGMIFILFIAGLEMDPHQFRALKQKNLLYGIFTSLFPFIGTIIVVKIWGYQWLTAVLVGSLFISHTMVAYPLISKMGLTKNEPVAVVVGSTIFNDIIALSVGILCINLNAGKSSLLEMAGFFSILIAYIAAILYFIPKLGRLFFKFGKMAEYAEFYFILTALFLSTFVAQLVHIHPLIGAFLSGLAISVLLEEDELLNKIKFFGEILFIPVFYITIGMEMDPSVLFADMRGIFLALTLLGVFLFTQFIGTLIPARRFRYNWLEIAHMWSLTIPQVAATLAILILAKKTGIVDIRIYNTIIIISIVTVIISPLLTAHTAKLLIKKKRFIAHKPQPPLSDFEFLVLHAAQDAFEITKGHPSIAIDDFVFLDVIERLLQRELVHKTHEGSYKTTALGRKILDKAEQGKVRLRSQAD